MLDIATTRRLAGRLARVPNELEKVSDEVGLLRGEVASLRAEILTLQSTLSATIDLAAKSTLDALAFTNRSVEGLNARMASRETAADPQAE